MPAAPKTSDDEILRAARELVQRRGSEALSMEAVGQAVGVRAPSLYKRYANRAALLGALRGVVALELRDAALAARSHGAPSPELMSIMRAIRAFAMATPHLYSLVLSATPGADLDPDVNEAMLAPLFAAVRRLCPRHTSDAARLLVAYVHGFVTMEIAGAFRLGGDLDASFEFGLGRIVRSLSAT